MFIDAGSMVIYRFECILDYFKSLPHDECGLVANKLLNYCKNKVLAPFYDGVLSDKSVKRFWLYTSWLSGVVFDVVELNFLLDDVLCVDNISIFLRDLEKSLPVNLTSSLEIVNHDLTNFLGSD